MCLIATGLCTSLFALGVTALFVMYSPFLFWLCQSDLTCITSAYPTNLQVVWETAESSRKGPPEGPGEGGVRLAIWRLYDPEHHQGQRNVWEARHGRLAQSANGTQLMSNINLWLNFDNMLMFDHSALCIFFQQALGFLYAAGLGVNSSQAKVFCFVFFVNELSI